MEFLNTIKIKALLDNAGVGGTFLTIQNEDGSFANGQENRIDFNQQTSTFGRISSYLTSGGNIGGFKFYGYNSGLNSSPIMTLIGSGYVGIGTATPTNAFQIGSNVYSNTGISKVLSLGGETGTVKGAASNIKLRIFDNAGSGYGIGAWSDGTNGSFEFNVADTYSDFVFYQNNKHCFWLRASNDVGVYGAYIRRNISTVGYGSGYYFQLNDSNGDAADYSSINTVIVTNTATRCWFNFII